MTTDLVEAVESARQTELSRLGSSKAIYAATEGQLEPDRVLAAMADALHHPAETLSNWAGAAEPFDSAADRLEAAAAQLEGELDGYEAGDPPAAAAALAAAEGEEGRLGALVGWSLVAGRMASQVTGFFTGQADPGTASVVRDVRGEIEAVREAAVDALAARQADREAALAAAESVVAAAYEDYVERLEAQGVNPKPVC